MTQTFEDFHFIRPAALLLLPEAIGLWLLWRRQADPLRGWREQIEAPLLKALTVGQEAGSNKTAQWMLVGWIVAIIAVSGPTWRLEPNPFADDATPLMILLKADVSMETPDPAPSRLERARLKIADLAHERKGQPLGLIVYSGSAHLVLPPTRDTEVVAQMAAEVGPDIMPTSGDRLDLALTEAKRILTDGAQGGSILVIADSVDGELNALSDRATDYDFPVQFLAINAADSSQNDSLKAAAKIMKANVVQLDVEDNDITAIARRAANAPKSAPGGQGERWQESGYWLTPLIAILVLLSFRREEQGEAA